MLLPWTIVSVKSGEGECSVEELLLGRSRLLFSFLVSFTVFSFRCVGELDVTGSDRLKAGGLHQLHAVEVDGCAIALKKSVDFKDIQ